MKFGSLGELIKEYREERGLSREELAKKIGIYRSSFNSYERNIYKPRFKRLRDICEILDIPTKKIEKIFPEYKKLQRADNLGNLLKKKRLEKGLTLKKLAERIEVSETMIWCYEKDAYKLRFEYLEKLMKILGISKNELRRICEYDKEYRKYKKLRSVDSLGDLLRKKRLEKRWTQEELAERIEISKNTIIFYEKNRYKPRFENLEVLRKIFGISKGELNRVCEYDMKLRQYKRLQDVDSLGDLLRKKRLKNGLTQEELADKIGTLRRNIMRYENNKHRPGILVLERLIIELDIPTTDLEKACKKYYKQYLEYKKDKGNNRAGLINAIKEYLRR